MAGRNQTKQVEFQGFVQVDLSDEDIDDIKALAAKSTELWKTVIAACADGYKFTLSAVLEDQNYKATFMDIQKGRTSAGYMLSGSSPVPAEAVAALMCKHTKKMGNDWVPFLASPRATNGIR